MKASLRTGVFAGALVALAGCQGWPNFDYEPLPDVVVQETDTSGNVAQNLGMVVARTIVNGGMDATGVSASGGADQFSHDGEYYQGDVDYFAFEVREPTEGDISLEWASLSTTVDLYLYIYNPETRGLDTLLDSAVSPVETPSWVYADDLLPGELYIIVVAGRSGPSTSYTLTLTPTPLSEHD